MKDINGMREVARLAAIRAQRHAFVQSAMTGLAVGRRKPDADGCADIAAAAVRLADATLAEIARAEEAERVTAAKVRWHKVPANPTENVIPDGEAPCSVCGGTLWHDDDCYHISDCPND